MEEAVHAVANSLAGVDVKNNGNVDCSVVECESDDSANIKEKDLAVGYKRVPGTQIQSDETEEFDAILRLQKPDCKNMVEGLRYAMPDVEINYAYGYPIAGNDTSHFAEALEVAKRADLIILTLGGKHGSCSVASMGEGVDGANINLPECQDAFIEEAAKLGKPMVGVHFNGRPISSDVADKHLNVIVEAWNPSEMGAQAIADVLTGAYNPSGKLPVTVAYHTGQLPIYYNHMNGSAWHQGESIGFKDYVDLPHTPRYYFGHGLSYTTFEYGKLQLDKKRCLTGEITEVLPTEKVYLTMEIKNTGSCAGTEVVQLYLKDRYASKTRPVMELAGFARVYLAAGEKKQVEFEVAPSQVAFLDENMQWKIEAGDIDVLVGSSSADIRQRSSFRIMKDAWIDGKDRKFYSLGRVR